MEVVIAETECRHKMHSLFSLVESSSWDELILEIDGLDSDDRQSLLRQFPGFAGLDAEHPTTLLHKACSHNEVPPRVVSKILEAVGPETAASCLDFNEQTPLHVAVGCACKPSIVELLVWASPAMVLRCDAELYRPIDILCQSIVMKEERSRYSHLSLASPVADDSVIERLWGCVHCLALADIAENAITTLERRELCSLPILHACLCANDLPWALVERAMKRYRHQFAQADDVNGNLPLHTLMASATSHDDDEDLTTEILQHYPSAARTPNKDGKLPLDLAIESRRGWNTGIALLLEANPVMLDLPAALIPLLLRKAAKTARWDLLYQLLRSNPTFCLFDPSPR